MSPPASWPSSWSAPSCPRPAPRARPSPTRCCSRCATSRCPSAEGRALLEDIGFDIHRGEVLGIAGVEGNGQAELVEAIMGMRPGATGSISLGGVDLSGHSTRERRESGIGYIPEDRHRHGLLLDSPLWENRMLGTPVPAARACGTG